MYVLGLDVGTQGARALVLDAEGEVLAQASQPFDTSANLELLPPGWVEQHPHEWWNAAVICLRKVADDLKLCGRDPRGIKAIAVDSTSGTIIPLDRNGEPLCPAIMYNDARSVVEADECNSAGSILVEKLGYKFSSAFALPKILWIKKNRQEIFEKASVFAHAVDFIVSKLTGNFRMSDTSNALKTGYDLVDRCWPSFIEKDLCIPLDKLPQIVSPGLVIGQVTEKASRETGIPSGTPVVAGVTDGTAGFLASGAVKVGDWNTTIGTTMVMRGVSTNLIKDPLGRIYCHAHPEGYWLPGGASNVGAECLDKLFSGKNLSELDAYVPQYAPTSLIVYPLVRKGERLPFVNPEAEGFILGQPRDSRDLYAAYLEGVGFVERWCFEIFAELGAEIGNTVYTTGGGAKSVEWMQVRANILNRNVVRPGLTECAVGAAVVAASKTLFENLEWAASAMVKPGEAVEPDPKKVELYDINYRVFREACASRGYI
ncbi:MAG: FGGY family carbohydrate kinase [Armatimonadota bacterium]|nr:FGGY family carbohydrate kinase [Armatimonadota bacterium]